MPEPKTLLVGLAFGESPRWHGDHLWFSRRGAQEVVAVDLNGNSEVAARVPTTIPFSMDWPPDGRLQSGWMALTSSRPPRSATTPALSR